MITAEPDVVRELNGVLQRERRGLLHSLGGAGTYVSGNSAPLKRALHRMEAQTLQHEDELAELIEARGGITGPSAVNMELQYLAFTSLDYLMPQLIQAKTRTIAAYATAIATIGDADPPAVEVLKRHHEGHQRDLEILRKRPTP